MANNIKAADWRVAGLAQIGGAAAVGGGVWTFEMRSATANHRGTYTFTGYGLGVGGSLGGASMPDFSTGGLSYTDLECERAFSADDLHGSAGRLTTAGAGLSVGYGVTIITAFNWGGYMFSSQECFGGTIGVGASAITTAGMWHRIG
ncbi:hypothetical protein KUV47_20285 [Vannielia litorea]|uniref:hypothetical protein n=1 Tax=Vannielia TaxID=2813041 RepID=UPI001C97F174|nr:hypothetical protein [Vannielia litorea]MBY6049775.1 hypothetical protein [Vannielia litorea]MBY6077189.1 hypothetical protein [Vannielia litorea]MBY6155568.1 hypothetical protein [Vannielia litorea]